jgi:peptidoglycan/LPS O-acetylase OafA/YrhL
MRLGIADPDKKTSLAVKAAPRLPELDSIRGLMAWWVVLVHTCEFFGIKSTPYVNVLLGLEAVNVFIVLSGFVIFFLLDYSKETYGIFLFRRFARIFPVYLAALVFAILSLEIANSNMAIIPDVAKIRTGSLESTIQHFGQHLAAHLTMLHGVLPEKLLPYSSVAILPPAWSLSLEWQFYLVAPLVFVCSRKPALSLMVLAALMVWVWIRGQVHLPRYSTDSFLLLNPEYFVLGGLSFFFYKWLVSGGERLTWPRMFFPGVIVLATFFVASKYLAAAVWIILFASICVVRTSRFPDSLSRMIVAFLNLKWLRFVGQVSFATYLIHEVVLHWTIYYLQSTSNLNGAWSFGLTLCIAWPVTLLIAIIIHYCIEMPCMAAARSLALKWQIISARRRSVVAN